VAQVTEEYDVPLHPIRGYNSATFCWNIARGWDDVTKPITIYYLGDHDPSGRDLERDVRERLTRYARRPFSWRRLGISPDQFDTYGVIRLEPKPKDKRTPTFVERWGRACAEVEAIPATELRRILRGAIEGHIPQGEWQRLQRVEALERQQWEGYMAAMFPQEPPA
jgi:hypothetical protein